MEDRQPIIFGYYSEGKLLGFRADSWGSLSLTKPKIYHYSEEQVQTILTNVRDEMNGSSSKFFEKLAQMNIPIQDMSGNQYERDSILEEVKKQEKEKKEYKDFEIHVIPFIGYTETWEYPEKWKVEAELSSLKEPLEIHKFTTIENQN